jgi:hypothetical protein
MSIVLPQPTSPYRYSPRGRLLGISRIAALLLLPNHEKIDLFGFTDSSVG